MIEKIMNDFFLNITDLLSEILTQDLSSVINTAAKKIFPNFSVEKNKKPEMNSTVTGDERMSTVDSDTGVLSSDIENRNLPNLKQKKKKKNGKRKKSESETEQRKNSIERSKKKQVK